MLSKKQEKRLLDLGRQVRLNEFPNPDRKGCPESKLIKQIAAGKIAAVEEDKWIGHFTSCSPCSREFSEFRHRFQQQKHIQIVGGSAVILVAIYAGIWLAVGRHARMNSNANIAANSSGRALQKAVLDLRGWSPVRSDEEAPNLGRSPLELHRGNLLLSIYMPMGSPPGTYAIGIVGKKEGVVLNATGTARIEQGITVLHTRLDLTTLAPGHYLLGVRQPPWDWHYFPITLH